MQFIQSDEKCLVDDLLTGKKGGYLLHIWYLKPTVRTLVNSNTSIADVIGNNIEAIALRSKMCDNTSYNPEQSTPIWTHM